MNGGRTQCNQQQMTRKHTNSTMQIIERKCEAQKGAGIRSNLDFNVVLWTVGKKTLDKLTDQPGILIPLDRGGVPDLSVSGNNFDFGGSRPSRSDYDERTRSTNVIAKPTPCGYQPCQHKISLIMKIDSCPQSKNEQEKEASNLNITRRWSPELQRSARVCA